MQVPRRNAAAQHHLVQDDLATAGVIAGAAKVEPEGRIGKRPGIGIRARTDTECDLGAPVGALRIQLGEVGGTEGRADTPPQLVANRIDDAGCVAIGAGIVAKPLQTAMTLLPLEQRVLERVAHASRLPAPARRRRAQAFAPGDIGSPYSGR
jgi:hypothetical protein